MTNDVNLASREWLNLVFEGKNKAYGAYVLREKSSNRHLMALVIVVLLGLSLVYLPNLIPSTPTQKPVTGVTGYVEPITIIDPIVQIPEAKPVETVKPTAPLPLLVRSAVQFTPPKIVTDEKFGTNDGVPTQATLTDVNADISNRPFAGAEGGTVHIGDVVLPVSPVEVEPIIYPYVEQAPVFDGLMQWLSDNIRYPAVALERGIEGRVILRFVVGPDGTVSNIEVQRSLDPSCDREAIRVVKSMPKWIPGRVNGDPVHVYFTLPVLFKLQK